ncbi:hypothetical protein PCE1_003427 [Barthelona sp. PCE]
MDDYSTPIKKGSRASRRKIAPQVQTPSQLFTAERFIPQTAKKVSQSDLDVMSLQSSISRYGGILNYSQAQIDHARFLLPQLFELIQQSEEEMVLNEDLFVACILYLVNLEFCIDTFKLNRVFELFKGFSPKDFFDFLKFCSVRTSQRTKDLIIHLEQRFLLLGLLFNGVTSKVDDMMKELLSISEYEDRLMTFNTKQAMEILWLLLIGYLHHTDPDLTLKSHELYLTMIMLICTFFDDLGFKYRAMETGLSYGIETTSSFWFLLNDDLQAMLDLVEPAKTSVDIYLNLLTSDEVLVTSNSNAFVCFVTLDESQDKLNNYYEALDYIFDERIFLNQLELKKKSLFDEGIEMQKNKLRKKISFDSDSESDSERMRSIMESDPESEYDSEADFQQQDRKRVEEAEVYLIRSYTAKKYLEKVITQMKMEDEEFMEDVVFKPLHDGFSEEENELFVDCCRWFFYNLFIRSQTKQKDVNTLSQNVSLFNGVRLLWTVVLRFLQEDGSLSTSMELLSDDLLFDRDLGLFKDSDENSVFSILFFGFFKVLHLTFRYFTDVPVYILDHLELILTDLLQYRCFCTPVLNKDESVHSMFVVSEMAYTIEGRVGMPPVAHDKRHTTVLLLVKRLQNVIEFRFRYMFDMVRRQRKLLVRANDLQKAIVNCTNFLVSCSLRSQNSFITLFKNRNIDTLVICVLYAYLRMVLGDDKITFRKLCTLYRRYMSKSTHSEIFKYRYKTIYREIHVDGGKKIDIVHFWNDIMLPSVGKLLIKQLSGDNVGGSIVMNSPNVLTRPASQVSPVSKKLSLMLNPQNDEGEGNEASSMFSPHVTKVQRRK